MKGQKGITLVALIITIVVLLILAVVSIGAVRDSGIIGHSQNAADTWQTQQATENSTMYESEQDLNAFVYNATHHNK